MKDLNFTVERGQRVLVTGGNGCGKPFGSVLVSLGTNVARSSLFRVIRKLWPLVEGTITMPPDKDAAQMGSKPTANHERWQGHLEFCLRSKGFYTGRRHYKT